MTTDKPTVATLLGRKVTIKHPGSMQLAAWNRTIKRFEPFTEDDKTGELSEEEREEFMTLLDRMYRMVMSILADEKDKDWLDDQMLDGNVTDESLKDFLKTAFKGLQDDAEDPAKKAPAKRARRTAS